MGPNRQNWTFPYTGQFLVTHLVVREKELAGKIQEGLDDAALADQKLNEFREQMREAGVIGWEMMTLPLHPPWSTYRGMADKAKDHYGRLSKSLIEIQRYRRALEHEVERDSARTFKLTFDDLEFLGL